MTKITVLGHYQPTIEIQRAATRSAMIAQIANVASMPPRALLLRVLPEAAWRGQITDAGWQITDREGDGDWTGAFLRGKAKRYSAGYVSRRRALAAHATALGLGRLIRIFPGHGNGRLVWRWSDVATARCHEIIAVREPLTAAEDDAITALAA